MHKVLFRLNFVRGEAHHKRFACKFQNRFVVFLVKGQR